MEMEMETATVTENLAAASLRWNLCPKTSTYSHTGGVTLRETKREDFEFMWRTFFFIINGKEGKNGKTRLYRVFQRVAIGRILIYIFTLGN